MTLDEAIDAAGKLLEHRGQLLNAHLLRLVEGDKDLFRIVRERLLADGIAEDRSGVGLALSEKSAQSASRHGPVGILRDGIEASSLGGAAGSTDQRSTALQSTIAEWWLMSAGTTQGPFTLSTLCEMRRGGQVKSADVVRCGTQGRWQQPDEVPDLFAARPTETTLPNSFRIGERLKAEREAYGPKTGTRIRSFQSPAVIEPINVQKDLRPHPPANSGKLVDRPESVSTLSPDSEADIESDGAAPHSELSTSNVKRFVPPDKTWSLGNQRRPGWLAIGWNLAADHVGGSRRLKVILAVLAAIGLFMYWWRQPPPARTIYNEFTTCRAAILKLQDRRAKRSEWAPVVDQYRPRVQFIVDRLRSRATDRYPLQKSLYLAGSTGLLPLLDNPMDPTPAERSFAQHIRAAQELLDKNISAKSTPPGKQP